MIKQQVEPPRGFASWGGVTVGAAAVLAIAAVGTQVSAGEPTSHGTVALAAAMADNSQRVVVSSWLFMLSAVMFVGFAAFIRARWQQASAWVPLAAALFVAAAAVDFAENLVAIGRYDVVVPAVAEQGATAGADLVVLGDALGVIAEHGHLFFHVVLGLAVLAFAAALLDRLESPRWMGYLAAAAGVVLTAYGVTGIDALLQAGSGLFAVWSVAFAWWSTRAARASVPATVGIDG
jgi:hypothetical protein